LLDIEDNDEEEEIEEVDDEQQVVVLEDHNKQLPFGAPKTKTATQALSLLPVSLTSAKARKRTRSGRNTNMVKEIRKRNSNKKGKGGSDLVEKTVNSYNCHLLTNKTSKPLSGVMYVSRQNHNLKYSTFAILILHHHHQ